MVINVKRVKAIIKEYGKQCTREFIDQLDFVVRDKIRKAVVNARHFKKLKASELL